MNAQVLGAVVVAAAAADAVGDLHTIFCVQLLKRELRRR